GARRGGGPGSGRAARARRAGRRVGREAAVVAEPRGAHARVRDPVRGRTRDRGPRRGRPRPRAARRVARPRAARRAGAVMGLALEAATSHAEVAVFGADGEERALEAEEVGNGHTQRLVPMVARALERAGLAPRELR